MRMIAIFLCAAPLAACSAEAQDGGSSASRKFDVASFSSVVSAGPHNVVVQVGPAASVRAEGPEDQIERLEIGVAGSDLRIGTRKGNWSFGSKRKPLTIYVTTPSLAGAEVAGSGNIRIDKVAGGRFVAETAGSGDIDIASLRVDDARFAINGSGGIRAAGSAGRAKVAISGSGDADLAGVETRTATVSVVGSGNVSARATDTANVSIMGSGDVTLGGSAKCKVSKMGSGRVRCGA